MNKNKNLLKAKSRRVDEFYTQMSDIEHELCHYPDAFREKTVYLNCDNPFTSNFFKYFCLNFTKLGLKKLIATCYDGTAVVDDQPSPSKTPVHTQKKQAYKAIINDVPAMEQTGAGDPFDPGAWLKFGSNCVEVLTGDGDFRSAECVELLKESDVCVTNVPFSLFRDYVSLMVKHNKKFLIVGSQNAITYKEIFPLLKDNKIWLGRHNGEMTFRVPDDSEPREIRFWVDEEGHKWRSLGNAMWFTNLDYPQRHEKLPLAKEYTAEKYPKYDNYDAVNVNKVSDIPVNYSGVMGVPITFLTKYCPEQFRLLGIMNSGEENPGIRLPDTPHGRPVVNGKELFLRILIRRIP